MKSKFLITLAAFFSISTFADSLLDIYNDALENDPQYKSAEYSYLSGKEIKVQGRAALLPSITLNAQTNWNEYYQNGNLQNQYNNFNTSARLTQPLLRLDSWFKYRQSKFLTDAAEADFAYSQQALIVRTAELYFNVLRAIDNLNAARSEEKAIKKQLDQSAYQDWAESFKDAQCLVVGKDEKIDQLQDQIENGLRLVGSTAIEDKLQEEVAETIRAFK